MRNKYPGTCYRCGQRVEPREGHFEKIKGDPNKWRVQHAGCAIQYRGTKSPFELAKQESESKQQPINTPTK